MASHLNSSMSGDNGAVSIRAESLPALRVFLQSEDHSFHACARAYVAHLRKDCKAAAAAAVASAVTPTDGSDDVAGNGNVLQFLSMDTTNGSDIDSDRASRLSSAEAATGDGDARYALCAEYDGDQGGSGGQIDPPPQVHPVAADTGPNTRTFLQWRNRATSLLQGWVRELGSASLRLEAGTTLAALSYLDAYSLSVCFPDEFFRIMGKGHGAHASSLPAPPKKRALVDKYEDYLWEYLARCHQQQEQKAWEETFESQYMLAALSSLYLACNTYQRPHMIPSWQFSHACKRRFSLKEIERMEWDILKTLTGGSSREFSAVGEMGFRENSTTRLKVNPDMMTVLLSCDSGNNPPLDSNPWLSQDGTQKNLFVHDVDHGHYSDTTDHTDNCIVSDVGADPVDQHDTNTGRPNHRGDQIRAHNTAAPTCARGIATPSPLDVLSGRGGQTNHHVGNARFRAEARKLRSEYRDGGTSPGKKGLLHRVNARLHLQLSVTQSTDSFCQFVIF